MGYEGTGENMDLGKKQVTAVHLAFGINTIKVTFWNTGIQ